MDISMDDVSEISQCASSISRDDVGIVHSSTTDESETNKVTNTVVSSNESVCTENLEMNDENVLTENKSEASFINEGVGIVYSSSNDEYETNKVANTVVKSYENVFTENLEMNDEIMHTENKPETILEIGHESFTNEEVGLEYCCDNDESERNIISNAAAMSNDDVDSENLELNYEKVLFESEPEASSEVHHKCFENEVDIISHQEYTSKIELESSEDEVKIIFSSFAVQEPEDEEVKILFSSFPHRRIEDEEQIEDEYSSPDNEAENANADCDPVNDAAFWFNMFNFESKEDPMFSSFPSYEPRGSMKKDCATSKNHDDGSDDSSTSRTRFEENKARQILPETMNNGTAEFNTIKAKEELSRAECEDDENGAWNNIFRTPKTFFHSYEDSVENICSGPFATTVEDPIESFASGQLFDDDLIYSFVSRSPPVYDLADNLDARTYDEEGESYAKSFEDDSDDNFDRFNRPSDDETAPGMKIKLFRKRAKKHHTLSRKDEEMEVEPSFINNTSGSIKSEKRCLSEDSDDEKGHLVGNNEAKRRKTHVIADFIENEAELSGEEASSDENESGEPLEAKPEVDVSQKKLMEMHMKHLKDDDDKLEKLIKNDFLDEGELFNERSRKFRWIAQEAVPEAEKIELSDSQDEAKVNIDTDKLKWQKETEVLKQESAIEADENVLVEPTGGKKYQLKILTKNNS